MSLPEQDTRARVASPCVRNCCLDDNDVCLGCARTLDEITAWGTASNGERRRILTNAARRQQAGREQP